MAAFAEDGLSAAHGTRLRGSFTPIAASGWMADPLAGGAYSYARPGATAARAALASSLDGRLHFAGEATAQDFATAHGAYLSGLTAAGATLAHLAPEDRQTVESGKGEAVRVVLGGTRA